MSGQTTTVGVLVCSPCYQKLQQRSDGFLYREGLTLGRTKSGHFEIVPTPTIVLGQLCPSCGSIIGQGPLTQESEATVEPQSTPLRDERFWELDRFYKEMGL